jgi:hypothetical protein
MANKKMIPCRVCGKFFEPCATCQAHNDIFRWRNFACSRECAEKYISETITYRNSSKEGKNNSNSVVDDVTVESNIVTVDSQEEKSNTAKRKYNRKKSTNDVDIINEEREQID